jgi:glycosyltransferase involved in cell wall biosynthesis
LCHEKVRWFLLERFLLTPSTSTTDSAAMSQLRSSSVRVAVLYRVKQRWRVPVFERLSLIDGYKIKVFHGPSFPGTKVRNYDGAHEFDSKEMLSIRLRMKTSNGKASMPFSPFLFFELWKYKPDIVLCEGASNLANNLSAYLYAKLFGAKTIQWGLGEIENRKKSGIRLMLDSLIEAIERGSDACIAYSSQGKEYYTALGVPESNVFVAVNVVDTEGIEKNISAANRKQLYLLAHENSDINILYVGALTAAKKVDLLLKSFAELARKTSKTCALRIVGEGPERLSLQALTRELGLDSVQFTGEVVDGVSRYFLESDIFVLPGLGGLAVSEAMAYGVPIICTVGDGCEKDLLRYGGGIRDPNLTVDSLVDNLVMLVENSELRTSMRKAAESTIYHHYNISTYVSSIRSCLDSVMGSGDFSSGS